FLWNKNGVEGLVTPGLGAIYAGAKAFWLRFGGYNVASTCLRLITRRSNYFSNQGMVETKSHGKIS
ncbi:MAG: hypothetical protein L3J13_10415, partial [Devosiaceae bacterium]|nr:hypothetical protein [Devosiaceae bacterium]